MWKTESMKLSITLFYSILFRLCWKRNDLFLLVSVGFRMFPYDLRPSSRTNIIFFPEKLKKQTIMKVLVKTIPVTGRDFLF